MSSVVNLIQATTYELTPQNSRLPPILWSAFTAFNKVHSLWRYYRRLDLYRQPESLAQMIAGHGVAHLLGDVYILRLAAQCVLVTTRIMECVKQQERLFHSGRRLSNALRGYYPSPITVKWEKRSGAFLLSPTTVHKCKVLFMSSWERVKRVALCILKIFHHLFLLSMRMMDVVDAISWGPEAGKEAVEEGFVNIGKCLGTMVENREEMLAGMEQNKEAIVLILKGTAISYEQLYSGVVKTLDKVESVYHPFKAVSEASGEALIGFGKRAFNGGRVVVGL